MPLIIHIFIQMQGGKKTHTKCYFSAFSIQSSSQYASGWSHHSHSETAQRLFSQSAEDLRARSPGVKPAGISSLAALAEVSHPAVVS